MHNAESTRRAGVLAVAFMSDATWGEGDMTAAFDAQADLRALLAERDAAVAERDVFQLCVDDMKTERDAALAECERLRAALLAVHNLADDIPEGADALADKVDRITMHALDSRVSK